MKVEEFKTLEEELSQLLQRAQKNHLHVGEIIEMLHGKGRMLILLILSLPFCQPLQIPGVSTPFGLVIAFIGLRMAFGKNIWLPKRIMTKEVSSETVTKIATKSLKIVKKIKFLIRPRLAFFCHNRQMEIINGLLIFGLGLILALPIPIPLTNLAAAWPIFLISLGILEDDGLFVLIGYLIALLSAALFVFLIMSVKNVF